MATISDKAAIALKAAVCTRGKAKGLLLARAPRSTSNAYAAWQAAQMVCNPFKVSIFGLVMLTEEQRAIYNEIEAALTALNVRGLDRDRNGLERLGVW